MKLYVCCMTLDIFWMIMDNVGCRLYWMVLNQEPREHGGVMRRDFGERR